MTHEEFIERIAAHTRKFVQAAIAPLAQRIAELEVLLPPRGEGMTVDELEQRHFEKTGERIRPHTAAPKPRIHPK
ncbi:MAG TPA: hypothetical protein VF814_21790 [Casimicrobiaceae bacterium]